MYYFFYKTTNILNNKVYYGVHSTSTVEDGYLGSGVVIHRAIKKYGKSNFNREILKFFDCRKDMYSYEKVFITEEIVLDKNTYNQKLGGFGGFSHIDFSGDKNPMRNPETVKKHVETKLKNGSYHTESFTNSCIKNLEKAIKYNTGRLRPEHAACMSKVSTEYWKNNKETWRDLHSSYFRVISPTGVEYRTNRLKDWCKENNLPYTTIWGVSVSGKIPKKGKALGWSCIKE